MIKKPYYTLDEALAIPSAKRKNLSKADLYDACTYGQLNFFLKLNGLPVFAMQLQPGKDAYECVGLCRINGYFLLTTEQALLSKFSKNMIHVELIEKDAITGRFDPFVIQRTTKVLKDVRDILKYYNYLKSDNDDHQKAAMRYLTTVFQEFNKDSFISTIGRCCECYNDVKNNAYYKEICDQIISSELEIPDFTKETIVDAFYTKKTLFQALSDFHQGGQKRQRTIKEDITSSELTSFCNDSLYHPNNLSVSHEEFYKFLGVPSDTDEEFINFEIKYIDYNKLKMALDCKNDNYSAELQYVMACVCHLSDKNLDKEGAQLRAAKFLCQEFPELEIEKQYLESDFHISNVPEKVQRIIRVSTPLLRKTGEGRKKKNKN